MAMTGKMVVFEGGDGTGKSTQAGRLKAHLQSKGIDPLHIREPGSTPVGERVRQILIGTASGGCEMTRECEMLLYMACRAELFRTTISNGLHQGRFVILERSYLSTYAYQGMGLGIDPEMILNLGRWICSGADPDRVILLDMEVDQSRSRLGSKQDRIERRGPAFHEKVRQGFLDLARRFPDLIRVVDADGTVEEVESRIHAELGDIL